MWYISNENQLLLSLTSDVREILAVLLDPTAAKAEDAAAAVNTAFRHPMAGVAVAITDTSALVTQEISARMQDIRHAKIMISAAVSMSNTNLAFSNPKLNLP
jgi:hypothetical protein